MNRYLLIALSVAVLVSCGKSTGEESKKEEKKDEFVVAVSAPDIFVGKNDGYNTFRIPAIVKSKDGTLLAFCEGRKNSGSDTGDIDLLLRRSIDGGNKWSRIITVWDDGSNTCGNPTPVVDPETGRIHLLMTWNFATDGKSAGDFNNGTTKDTRRVFYTYSDDDGVSWSKPVEITDQAKKPEWGWYATGPCHGIVLSKGAHKGRIIVPCDANERKEATGSTTGYSLVIYSDDHGKTWHIGGTVKGGNESCAAELEDGRILLTCRASGGKRLLAWSSDGGETFSAGKANADLPDPRCQGSCLSHTWNGTPVVFHINCADASTRTKLTVKASVDGGEKWNSGYKLTALYTAYSDIVMLDDNIIVIFYENGSNGSYEKISIQKTAISYILK